MREGSLKYTNSIASLITQIWSSPAYGREPILGAPGNATIL